MVDELFSTVRRSNYGTCIISSRTSTLPKNVHIKLSAMYHNDLPLIYYVDFWI